MEGLENLPFIIGKPRISQPALGVKLVGQRPEFLVMIRRIVNYGNQCLPRVSGARSEH